MDQKPKRPAFQFYPGDWRKDVELRSCSIAARGLWIDLMCVMHDCEPYGHLSLNGKPMTVAQIAGQIGIPAAQVKRLLDELITNGVARVADDGTIFCKRMVDDERVRNARAEGGKAGATHGTKGASHGAKGGRPKAAEGVGKGGFETPLPGEKKPPPSSSSSSSIPEEEKLADNRSAPARADTTGFEPTQAGAICAAMRAAGLADVNPGHPTLLALLEAGATEAEFVGAARTAVDRQKGFAYALAALQGQREDAAKAAQGMHRGPMPAPTGKPLPPWKSAQLQGAAILTGSAPPPAAAPTTSDPETIDVDARILPT